ncbi:autoimmune regulator-like, partial [Sinocyclocheilus grahami]|uniref:autoimmune regulator-like n=1 Tax=Sinocyclocheilus grahami TaxID=75366 RepID=UPI0007AC6BF3
MSRVEGYGESDLRSQLRAYRTEIAMAIHDPFPLLYGLADHDIISEQILRETLERKKKDGIHKAVYSLLTLILDQDATVLQGFWSNLCKEYNKQCYPKLETLVMNLPKGLKQVARHAGNPRFELQSGKKRGLAEKQMTHRPHHHTKKALTSSSGSKGKQMRKTDGAALSQVSVGNGCDGCPRAFHLTCLVPPLTSIPSGTWRCQLCQSNRAKDRTYTPLQPAVHPPVTETSSSSAVDFSFFSSLSSTSLSTVSSVQPMALQ